MNRRGHRNLALLVLLACGLAILVARGSEAWLGLVPCAFCLLERWPYYIGAGLGLLALLLPRPPARAVLWLATTTLLAAAGLSLVHTGVEQHWWRDPLPECTTPHFTGLTMDQRLSAMPARPAKPCEDPDYLIPGLPVSMTQMGLAYALAVAGFIAMSLSRTKGRAR